MTTCGASGGCLQRPKTGRPGDDPAAGVGFTCTSLPESALQVADGRYAILAFLGGDWRFNVEAINVLRGIPRTLGSSVCLLTSGWYSALTVANRAAAESRSEP
jgi:hypothetical protein